MAFGTRLQLRTLSLFEDFPCQSTCEGSSLTPLMVTKVSIAAAITSFFQCATAPYM